VQHRTHADGLDTSRSLTCGYGSERYGPQELASSGTSMSSRQPGGDSVMGANLGATRANDFPRQ
jgi:hypothetical protein